MKQTEEVGKGQLEAQYKNDNTRRTHLGVERLTKVDYVSV